MAMPYLPRPLPGELVSSVIMRAARHLGRPVREVTASLTGRQVGPHPPFLVPYFLDAVAQLTGKEPRTLLAENSLFPYLTAPLTASHVSKVEQAFLQPDFDGRHAMPTTAYLQIPGVTTRRFCFQCVAADCTDCGESYWHREHQLPGVDHCVKHQCRLTESGLGLHTPTAEAALLPSDLVSRYEEQHFVDTAEATVEVDWFTDASVRALNAPRYLAEFPYAQAASCLRFHWDDAYSRAQLVGAAFAGVNPSLAALIPNACLSRPSVVVPGGLGFMPWWPTMVWIIVYHYLAEGAIGRATPCEASTSHKTQDGIQ